MTKAKLEKFKKELLDEKKELLEGLHKNNENISSINAVTKSGDIVDQAYSFYEKELLIGLSTGEKETLKNINHALKKIDDKTFGICEECNKPIEEKRLEAIPYAIRCVECKKKSTKKPKAKLN